MKTLKSKQNIIVLILTSVICLVIIGYALINVYNTKLARSSSTSNTDTTSISKLSPSTSIDVDNSNFYKTLTLTCSKNTEYSYNRINFDNPFNVSFLGIEDRFYVDSSCSNEIYTENSECYIYVKCKLTDENIISQIKNINDESTFNSYFEYMNDLEVNFMFNGNIYNGASEFPIGSAGASCWRNYCFWDRNNKIGNGNTYTVSNSLYCSKATLDDDGYFYLAIRYITPQVTYPYQTINVEVTSNRGNISNGSFQITVYDTDEYIQENPNEASLDRVCNWNESNFYNMYGNMFNNDIPNTYGSSGNDSNNLWGRIHGKGWQINLIQDITKNQGETIESKYKNTSPGGTINIDDITYLNDYYEHSNNTPLSFLSASPYFKVLLLYPEYGYDVNNSTLLNSNIYNNYFECHLSDGHYIDLFATNNYEHTIPSWWNKDTYTVMEIFFNDWCPKGQSYSIKLHTYNVDLISINTEETLKQENHFYTENSEVYTYLVANYGGNDYKNALKDIRAEFTVENVFENNQETKIAPNYYLEYDKFVNMKNQLENSSLCNTYNSDTGVFYLAIRWRTPEIISGSKDYNVIINLYNDNNIIGTCSFKIAIHDTDYINQYSKLTDYYGKDVNLSTGNAMNKVFDFENATKQYYEENVKDKIDSFSQSKTYEKLVDNKYTNQIQISNGQVAYFEFYELRFDINKYNNKFNFLNTNNTNPIKAGEIIGLNQNIYSQSSITTLYNPTNRKVLVLYPEYGYDIEYGDLMISEDYFSTGDTNPTLNSKSINQTVSSNLEYSHTIPIWWDENKDYTIIEIIFNEWTPFGELYYIQEITYNVEGSVYGDWYITRNVD